MTLSDDRLNQSVMRSLYKIDQATDDCVPESSGE